MKTNRRDFLKTLGGVALFSIVPRHVLGNGYIAPSDQLTKGIIGTGGMGRNHLNYAGTRLVAVCDVDKKHLELRDTIQKLYYEVHDRKCSKTTKHLFVKLCKKDIELAPYINSMNDFPTFYFLSEYYYNVDCDMLEALQICLKGIKYKFEDTYLLYNQIEIIIKYLKKFSELQLSFDYENNCLYDEKTGEIIEDIYKFTKQIREQKERDKQ
jgi:hypothetical protein